MRTDPSGLNASPFDTRLPIARRIQLAISSPDDASQSVTRPSSSPVAISLPSGLYSATTCSPRGIGGSKFPGGANPDQGWIRAHQLAVVIRHEAGQIRVPWEALERRSGGRRSTSARRRSQTPPAWNRRGYRQPDTPRPGPRSSAPHGSPPAGRPRRASRRRTHRPPTVVPSGVNFTSPTRATAPVRTRICLPVWHPRPWPCRRCCPSPPSSRPG